MGIEPTYLAWKASVLPLNYTRVLQYTFFFSSLRRIGVTGFEPATPCSQSRCSSQTEPHPVVSVCLFLTVTSFIIHHLFLLVNTFFIFLFCHISQRQVLLYLISFHLSTSFFFFLFFLFSLTLKCFLKQNVTKNALLLLHQFP